MFLGALLVKLPIGYVEEVRPACLKPPSYLEPNLL